MLGDWVRITDDDTDEFYIVPVAAISSTGNIYASIESDSPIYQFAEDCIDPIPLTPEILEKNFEKKTFYGIYDDYFDLDIREYSDSVYVATFHNCEMNIPDQQMTFSFVHELQHFLNHCGIEKEIEL